MKLTVKVPKDRATQILQNAYNADSTASFNGKNIVSGSIITAISRPLENSEQLEVEISSNYFMESSIKKIIEN